MPRAPGRRLRAHNAWHHTTRKKFVLGLVYSLSGWLVAAHCDALGEQLLDTILRSDFVFDRGTSNTPFLPLGYLTYQRQPEGKWGEDCTDPSACSLAFASVSQGLSLPVYADQKHLLFLGQTLQLDRFELRGEKASVHTLGLLGAWVAQPNPAWQTGLFAYGYRSIGERGIGASVKGHYLGGVARYRHRPELHSYFGVIQYREQDNQLWLPYLGFDWFVSETLSISGVLPSPSVSYAPSPHRLWRLGLLASGSSWAFGNEAAIEHLSFSQWQLGVSFEHRLRQNLWAAVSVGATAGGRFALEDDQELDLTLDLDHSGFVEIGIKFRPEVGSH